MSELLSLYGHIITSPSDVIICVAGKHATAVVRCVEGGQLTRLHRLFFSLLTNVYHRRFGQAKLGLVVWFSAQANFCFVINTALTLKMLLTSKAVESKPKIFILIILPRFNLNVLLYTWHKIDVLTHISNFVDQYKNKSQKNVRVA